MTNVCEYPNWGWELHAAMLQKIASCPGAKGAESNYHFSTTSVHYKEQVAAWIVV